MRPTIRRSFPPNKRGFTLIEVLLAIFIAAIAMTIVNLSFYQAHRSIQAVSAQREAYQMVRIVMDRMIKDLDCAYMPCTGSAAEGEQPRVMTEEQISFYRFVGADELKEKAAIDSIHFTTTTDLGLPGSLGVISEVGYYLKEMEDVKDRYVLIRTEDQLPHSGVSEKPKEMEVAENVVSLDIKYIDSELQEQDSWDLTEKLYLPKQVKVTITFEIEKELVSFTGVAFLTLSDLPKLTLSQIQSTGGTP